jgi:signal transduction histidine kinase
VPEGSTQDATRPTQQASGRFATLLEQDHDAILTSFRQRMEDAKSPFMSDPAAQDQVMTICSEIVTDVVESVRAGRVRIDDHYKRHCWMLGEAQARSHLTPADSMRAAVWFFDVTVTSLSRHVQDDPELLPCFVTAILALNQSTTLRIREITLAYTGCLLDRIHHAHLNERRRIARELHDRLGEGLSAGLRQFELYEITSADDSPEPWPGVALGKEALIEAMRRLRLVIADLRQDPVTSLEKALNRYLDSIVSDVGIRLRVTGDEAWAWPTVIDETYLILREAIRNSLAHGDPQLILIGVDLSPHELRAWVADDGRGFVVPESSEAAGMATAGLASMRERADVMGGRLSVSSAPGQGTEIELFVPLSGQCHER